MNEAIDMSTELKHHTIADNCVLATLECHRVSTSRRASKSAEQRIRNEENDNSLTLRRNLFKDGPVRDLLRLIDAAYNDHKELTAPWIDKGPRLLPGPRFQAYADRMNDHAAAIDKAAQDVVANWSQLVHADIQRRQTTGQKQISIDEYPTQDQAAQAFGIQWRVAPVPQDSDFRVQVPEYVKQRQRESLQRAVDGVRVDLLKRMLEPVRRAAEKLAVPIGEDGSVFRDSLVGNLKDALAQAQHLNISGDPDIAAAVTELRQTLMEDVGTAESLRLQQEKRTQAASKLSKLADTFEGLL